MLRTLLQMKMPYYIARQERAPLLRQREAFLEHLLQQGTSIAAARMAAWQLLNVIELLDLTRLRAVGIDEIQAAGKRWARKQRANPLAHSYNRSASYFVYVAKKWLRFAGMLKVPAVVRMRYADELDDFAKWMAEEGSLAAMTVRGRRNRVLLFLRWLSERRQSLAKVRIRDLDDYLISQGNRGLSRKTLNSDADALRTFFRYGEQRGWTRPSIAEGIISPRIYAQEGLPEGPEWKQVKRMLAGATGNKASALRARAILLLLAIYGLRCGEVCRLQLSDFDWRTETFTVNHSKRGGVQRYPLQREVGDAILNYLRRARPRSCCPNLFLTLKPPYRAIRDSALWKITNRSMRMAGVQCRHRGPHTLRHACATHLLERGASMKEIGDLLGHRDYRSTSIYAKVHLLQLRQVADFDLGGLL